MFPSQSVFSWTQVIPHSNIHSLHHWYKRGYQLSIICLRLRVDSLLHCRGEWESNPFRSTDGRFFLSQCIRISKTTVIAAFIDSVFDGFRDEKDSGPLTLTHLYLLIGCALPVWLSLSGTKTDVLFPACAGVISIGLGDSAASICGSYLGRNKWPGSKKSYEGTAAAFVTQSIGSIFIFHYFYPHQILQFTGFLVIAATCLLVSLVEAFTREIDNLVLSLYFYISFQGLSLMCNILKEPTQVVSTE